MDYSILVMSSDGYSDLWEPFASSFKRYWSDCPAQIYLATESMESDNILFKSIKCGKEMVWTERLGCALNQIDTDYLIMLCEDYLLYDVVNNREIDELMNMAKAYKAGNLRLVPNPKSDRRFAENKDFFTYEKEVPYRISMQAGIWAKDYLMKYANLNTNIRGFERLGSQRSNLYNDPILTTERHVFPFVDSINKGKWELAALSICSKNGIAVDLDYRPPMTNLDYLKKHGKGVIMESAPVFTSNVMNLVSKLKRLLA